MTKREKERKGERKGERGRDEETDKGYQVPHTHKLDKNLMTYSFIALHYKIFFNTSIYITSILNRITIDNMVKVTQMFHFYTVGIKDSDINKHII